MKRQEGHDEDSPESSLESLLLSIDSLELKFRSLSSGGSSASKGVESSDDSSSKVTQHTNSKRQLERSHPQSATTKNDSPMQLQLRPREVVPVELDEEEDQPGVDDVETEKQRKPRRRRRKKRPAVMATCPQLQWPQFEVDAMHEMRDGTRDALLSQLALISRHSWSSCGSRAGGAVGVYRGDTGVSAAAVVVRGSADSVTQMISDLKRSTLAQHVTTRSSCQGTLLHSLHFPSGHRCSLSGPVEVQVETHQISLPNNCQLLVGTSVDINQCVVVDLGAWIVIPKQGANRCYVSFILKLSSPIISPRVLLEVQQRQTLCISLIRHQMRQVHPAQPSPSDATDKKRRLAMRELLVTERDFLKNIQAFSLFQKSLLRYEAAQLITQKQAKQLLHNVSRIVIWSSCLISTYEKGSQCVLAKFSLPNLQCFVDYVRNASIAVTHLKFFKTKSIVKKEHRAGFTLDSLLMLPIKRVMRYRQLLLIIDGDKSTALAEVKRVLVKMEREAVWSQGPSKSQFNRESHRLKSRGKHARMAERTLLSHPVFVSKARAIQLLRVELAPRPFDPI